MAKAWRIDTLDPRGGLTFVSWREPTLFDEAPLEEAPVFYIGAPSFTPLPVANRSVALAAERHGFQLGLLDKEGEVPFETLDDVAEFVRRIYLASARGDTADPSGAAPLPVPLPRPPDESPPTAIDLEEPAERAPLADAVARFLRRFPEGRGSVVVFDWRETLTELTRSERAIFASRLKQGAAVLLRELLARFPDVSDAEALERWRVSAAAFAAVVRRLDLRPELADDISLQRACNRFLKEAWSEIEPDAEDVNVLEAVEATLLVMTRQTLHGPWRYGDEPTAVFSSLEPMDELARLPIPHALAAAIGAANPNRASVATLLSSAVGSPAAIGKVSDVEAVLLFAACRVVAVDGAPFLAARGYGAAPGWDGVTLEFRRGQMLMAAGAWLAENLPRLAFHPVLEAMIANVAIGTTFRSDPTGGSGPGGESRGAADVEWEEGFRGARAWRHAHRDARHKAAAKAAPAASARAAQTYFRSEE